jgi:hypothetical protein
MAVIRPDGSVEISVSDTGVGIAVEDKPKIFEEFRQMGSEYAHNMEGTGLGLTLAKKFVELHGGRSGSRVNWAKKRPLCLRSPTNLQVSQTEEICLTCRIPIPTFILSQLCQNYLLTSEGIGATDRCKLRACAAISVRAHADSLLILTQLETRT